MNTEHGALLASSPATEPITALNPPERSDFPTTSNPAFSLRATRGIARRGFPTI